MPGFENMGRMLLILGGIIILLGLLFTFGNKIPFLGRLPGDIRFQRGNFSCSFPIVTSLLISLILTVLLNIILRFLRK
jgi:hypothetical protein